MADFYADSSTPVKRHVLETGSAWFRALAASGSGNVITTAHISIVEVISALNRRVREGTLAVTDYALIVADFDALCASQYTLLELTPSVISRARRLLEQHPLRAYDAIQLASALVANDALLASGLLGLSFVAADHRLLQAAQTEGLPTDNPNAHP